MDDGTRIGSPENRTNVRSSVPRTVQFARFAFETVGPRLPALATSWAERLFLTPGRYRPRDRERYALSTGRALDVPSGFGRLAAWSWGAGPVVVLVHGWGGAGAQLTAFVPSLVSAGFTVVTFDAPAHGASPGRTSSLLDFSEALRDVARRVGEPHAIVAHSMGAPASALALRAGLHAERAVFLGPPADVRDATARFARAFGLPATVREAMEARLEQRFGVRMSELNVPATAAALKHPTALLVVHDRDDRDVPWQDGARVATAWPGAKLVTTAGLGHRRVLRDPGVIDAVTSFIGDPRAAHAPSPWLGRARDWPIEFGAGAA